MRTLHNCGELKASWTHRVVFCRDALGDQGAALAALLPDEGPSTRLLAVIDSGLARAREHFAGAIESWASAHQVNLVTEPMIVAGGERAKNDRMVFDRVARAINDHHICRRSVVLVAGGGAVLDAVGYAAASSHRGVRLVRMPSTTLAQADAGVGVKNGINAFGNKNFLGAFAPPWAVVNDTEFLTSLSDAHWRDGLTESIKVAMLQDPSLLELLDDSAVRLATRDLDAMEAVVMRTAELHVRHIVSGGDPFESRQARPLDFGHWSAHQLEQMTGFGLSHGEAVGIGILIDVQYAALIGLAPGELVTTVHECLDRLGLPCACDALGDEDRLLEGLERFREHLGGRLTITLVSDVGVPVDVHEIDEQAMRQAIRLVRRRHADQATRAG